MKGRIAIFSLIVTVAALFIGWMFWQQELKYVLPTPVPDNFKDVAVGERVYLSKYGVQREEITMLHFFNPNCPCSRFNMKEFQRLSNKYKDKANVYVILQSSSEEDMKWFSKKYDLDIPILLDKEGAISDRCGIYSTPQSVLLDRESRIYFKGNYNLTRYCTRKETSFAESAMDSLLQGKELPFWIVNELTVPYGCSLPSDVSESGEEIEWFFN